MKPILAIIIGITIVLLVALVIYFGLATGERAKSEEDWFSTTSQGSVNGTWGTSVEVEYADGHTDVLNVASPLFEIEIKFKDKKVSNFKYILSTKGASDEYDSIEIDMSEFEVITYVGDQDEEKQWEGEATYGDTITLDMDGEWAEAYRIQVDADELEMLEVGDAYNLSFTPSGAINYRGSATGDWINVPLPDWFYIQFNVKEESTNGNGNGDGDKWIEVELGEESET